MYHIFGAVIVPDVLELKIWAEIIWKLSEVSLRCGFTAFLQKVFPPQKYMLSSGFTSVSDQSFHFRDHLGQYG